MRIVVLGLSASLLSASAVFAADLGQYRPGQSYQSVMAAAADICEHHCAGDAQCRSWNFVKANPKAPGVCEFNSDAPQPVSSAIAISGTNLTPLNQYPSVISGQTNTIRVGTQALTKPKPQIRNTASGRRIVRQAAPTQIRPQQASTRPRVNSSSGQVQSLTAQQNQYRETPQKSVQTLAGQTRRAAPMPPSMQGQARPQEMARPQQMSRPQQMVSRPQNFTYDLGGRAAPLQPQTNIPASRQAVIPRQPASPRQASNPRQAPNQRLAAPNQAYNGQNFARPNSRPNPRSNPMSQPTGYAPVANVQNAPQYPSASPMAYGRPQMQQQADGRVIANSARDRRRQQGPNRLQARAPQPVAPQFAPNPSQPLSQNQSYAGRGQAYPPQAGARPQAMQEQRSRPPQQAMARRSAYQPVTHQEARMPQSGSMPQARQSVPMQGLSPEQAQRSLYGKLNDDVRIPNPVATVPMDPDMPIPTMASRPTAPVQQEPLDGLAGAPTP